MPSVSTKFKPIRDPCLKEFTEIHPSLLRYTVVEKYIKLALIWNPQVASAKSLYRPIFLDDDI